MGEGESEGSRDGGPMRAQVFVMTDLGVSSSFSAVDSAECRLGIHGSVCEATGAMQRVTEGR